MTNSEKHTWLGSIAEVAAGLLDRAGCAEDHALHVAGELSRLDDTLRPAFKVWWDHGGIPDLPVIEGYSPKGLIDCGRCLTVPVAFTWLDGLVKHPGETLRRLNSGVYLISDKPETVWSGIRILREPSAWLRAH